MVHIIVDPKRFKDSEELANEKKEFFAKKYEKVANGDSKPEHYNKDGEINWRKWQHDTNQEFNRKS